MQALRSIRGVLLALPLAAFLQAPPSLAADPRLPPGQDPGGQAIALISTGVDYASERIAPRVARDGEGEMIGWDFIDNDRFPYAPAAATPAEPEMADATSAAAAMLAAYARGRMIPVRIADGDPVSLAKAIGFAAGTPARIVAIAVPLATPDMRRVIREASTRFKDHLFVVQAPLPEASRRNTSSGATKPDAAPPSTAGTTPAHDSLLNLGNVLVVAASGEVEGRRATPIIEAVDVIVVPRGSTMFVAPPVAPPRNGIEAVAMAAAAAACQGHGAADAPLLGSAAKAATLEIARPLDSMRSVRLLDPMCWYGGKRM